MNKEAQIFKVGIKGVGFSVSSTTFIPIVEHYATIYLLL